MANILLGVTGSVAAVKSPELAAALRDLGYAVRAVVTKASEYFIDTADLGEFVRDADEWPGHRYRRGDPVLHIELRRWADCFVVAPLDANTLAKLANGLADNCLTCVWRAWDTKRPAVLAPAMNTLMWQHPATVRHMRQITDDNPHARFVLPVEKELACGDNGIGAMAAVGEIVAAVAGRI